MAGELATFDRLCGGATDPGRFLELAIGAVTALGEAHAAGLIHRDVKPHAFLLDGTGSVHLGDLALATRVPRRELPAARPDLIEGTLAYMSPEQTGRMNRAVDQRSDLYSLGVTLYQLLTGALPFAPADPLEWLHCHLARTPAAPTEVDPAVPEALSGLIMKLLAKDPEDRYQSAAGVLADLATCRAQWAAQGAIAPFPLGTRDVSDHWRLPQRLFGREADGARLRAAFERVASGAGPEVVVLSGPAGVGKSALVNDLLAPVARAGGVFLAGKFDEYDQRVPYAPFVQALRGRVDDLLTGTDSELQHWRERLGGALGAQGRVMVELIPALELVLGRQPPVLELGAAESQARVGLLARSLLLAVAEPGRPLVLFLDDLQWADPPSLRLLEQLVDREAHHLLLIGAYRDSDVPADHPLRSTFRSIRKAGTPVDCLPVAALPPVALDDLVAATLRRSHADVAPLAALVHGKTGGNPFFARQFLTGLYADGLIAFDRARGQWAWDVDRIAGCDLTSNVAELMAARVARLAPRTRQALQVVAAAGDACDLGLLATLLGLDERAVDDLLAGVVTDGLLVRRERAYHLAHDRVRQAAYATIPVQDRPALHLRVGRSLLQRTPEAALDDVAFELARQFNLGASGLVDPNERLRAADLNLRAGLRAKRSAAHGAAVAYLTDGIAHVQASGEVRGPLAFTLELERAGCELLAGHLDRARALLADLLERATTAPQKAAIYRLRQGLFQLTGEIALAVEDELAGLRACGIELPARPTDEDVARERANVQRLLAAHPPEALLALPPMEDVTASAATQLVTPSFFTDPRLFFVHVARMVALIIERGLSDNASYFFFNYALALAAFGEYRQARALAEVGRQLAARQPLTPRLPEAVFILAQVSYWTDSYDDVIARYREAYQQGLKNGAIETPAMVANSVLMVRLARGDALAAIEEEADAALVMLERAGARDMRDVVVAERQFARRLRGRTRGLDTFDEEGFDGEAFIAALTPERMTTAMCWCLILAQRAAYLAGDLADARAVGDRAGALVWSTLGLPGLHDHVLYRGLTLAASLDGERRDEWLAELRAHEQQARVWAELNPPSFRHNHLLLAAEVARVEGRTAEAAALYDQSAAGAAAGGFALDEALAWELAARYHRARGAERLSELCLREARGAYARGDAQAKVRQLDRLLAGRAARGTGAAAYAAEEIDLLSVVRASLAISGETTVEQVTRRLMELVLAEGGAERGLLLVPRGEHLIVAARAAVTGARTEVQVAEEPALAATVPLSLVSYVWRTGESLLLDDASREPRFNADPYVARERPRAVLVTPIRRQGHAVGLVYLENRAVAGVFRPRLQVLELLAAQAAISLENAALLGQERLAREAALEAVRLREEFLSVASHELNTPLSSLTLSVQALREAGSSRAEAARLTELIDRQATRLNRLVGDLLDATRMQQKQLVLEREATELATLVRDVVGRLGPQLQRVRCTPELVLSPVTMNVDRGRLDQVLSNLLSNAMKFGAGKPITISVSQREGRARLVVTDRGMGIDPARQPRIFDRFERGVSWRHYGGLGLGLYICRQIVEAHGGTIAVDSRPGEGATFTVELPIG